MNLMDRRLRKIESIQLPRVWKMVALRGYERQGETTDSVIAKWRSENPDETANIFFIVRMIVDQKPSRDAVRNDLH